MQRRSPPYDGAYLHVSYQVSIGFGSPHAQGAWSLSACACPFTWLPVNRLLCLV
jgi:hypothetical protein